MKRFVLLFVVLLVGMYAKGQNTNPNYDSTLAQHLGADEYGMKMYYFVLLKSGTNTTADKVLKDSLFMGHMANINKMLENKKLIVAGPMGKNSNQWRGIFILEAKDEDEVQQLLSNDPAITNNLLAPEISRWYGSAALPEYLKVADKIWQINP
jgi:uncharacterized protein YciI